jgi:hypothetical protein
LRAALVVAHERKSIFRHEIGYAFRDSTAVSMIGDSYLVITQVQLRRSAAAMVALSRFFTPASERGT